VKENRDFMRNTNAVFEYAMNLKFFGDVVGARAKLTFG
jgi:hypothetical protein